MGTLRQDIRFAGRMLRKAPGFTAIALMTPAIGIGANTITFSVSDLLLMQAPRKVTARGQLASVSIDKDRYECWRYPEYLTLRESGLAAR